MKDLLITFGVFFVSSFLVNVVWAFIQGNRFKKRVAAFDKREKEFNERVATFEKEKADWHVSTTARIEQIEGLAKRVEAYRVPLERRETPTAKMLADKYIPENKV